MKKISFFIACLFFVGIVQSNAQLTDLHSFADTNSNNNGSFWGDVIPSGNVLFGMISSGGPGDGGYIFSLHKDGSGYKYLYHFDYASGYDPTGSLLLSGGVLYGTTWQGGANDWGTLFSIDTNGNNFRDIYDLTPPASATIFGSLVISGNVLYGMLYEGGGTSSYDYGSVFSIHTDGTGFTELLQFDSANGEEPIGSLIVSGTKLYGMTIRGGTTGKGVVFTVDTNGHNYKKLLDFNGLNGSSPIGDLAISGKVLYGMTELGGADTLGILFSIDTNGRNYRDLLDFDYTNGGYPVGKVVVSGRLLYGVTDLGRDTAGNIFSIDTDGSGYRDIWDFPWERTTITGPYGDVNFSGGVLYGITAWGGGGYNDGGVYSLDTNVTLQCFPYSISSTPTCSSSNIGTSTITLLGGTSPYTYLWLPGGQTTATATGLSAGNYSVTVHDNTGCKDSATVIVSPQSESYTITCSPAIINTGDSTGLHINSILPATYSWSPSASVAHPDSSVTYAHPPATTEYTVTITTACATFTDSVLVTVNCFPITTSSTASCPSSSTGSASVSPSGGTSPYTYSWSPGGETTASVTNISGGSYSVTVYDHTGCSAIESVSVSSLSESFTISSTLPTVTPGDTTYLYATSSRSATYSWAPSATVDNPTFAGTYARPLTTTEYTVTITTACATYTDSVLITVINCFTYNLSSTATCFSSNSGTATATVSGGIPPFTYSWSPGGETTASITGLPAGNYSVTIKDASGCIITNSVSVPTLSESFSVSGTPTIIIPGDSTLLSVTSALPATYSWSPSSSVTHPDSAHTYAHPTIATEYTVTITTACGTYTDSVLITVNCFTTTMSSTLACISSSNGTATITASGGVIPYTYLWSPGGETTTTITGLSAGIYSVITHDATGCSASSAIAVLNDSIPVSYSASGNPTIITVGDSTLLTATCNVPATYSWAPATSVTNPNSASTYAHPSYATEYTVTITTACGTYTDSVLITLNCFTYSLSTTPTCSSNSGTATASALGGTPPYTYSWTPGGGTTAIITGLSAGNYSVTIQDASGCSSSDTISVSYLTESIAAYAYPSNIVIGDSAYIEATSTLPATYSWAPAASVTNPTDAITYAHPTVATEYTVTITTACGTYTDSILISANCIVATAYGGYSSCYNGRAYTYVTGGTTPYTYLWSPSGQTTEMATGLGVGTFTVTVHDLSGCVAVDSAVIDSMPLYGFIMGTPMFINPGDSTTLSIDCYITPATYSWAPSSSVVNPTADSTNAYPPVTTEYTVTVNTTCGTIIDSILITVNCFSVTTSSTNVVYCSDTAGTVTAIASGGSPPYTYSWSPGGQTTATATGLSLGYYTVIVHDATGCMAGSSAPYVSENPFYTSVSATPPVIAAGDTSLLMVTSNHFRFYSWAPSAGLSCSTCPYPLATPTVTTIYTCTVHDSCGEYEDFQDTVFVSNCPNNYNQPICVVTIDTATGKYEVIWNRTNSPYSGGYGDFYIYRDTSSWNILVHTQPLNTLSDYIDPNSNPSIGPVSYQLATLDSCGESALSPPHTSIYLTTTAGTNVFILSWTPYVGFIPTEYRIFRGASMHSLVQIDSVPSTTLTYHDTLPPTGSFYAVEAVSPTGVCIPTTHIHIRPGTELSGSFSNGFNTAVLGIKPITGSIANLNIYPNPSNGQFTIQWSVVSNQLSEVKISVIDELGQVVYAENKNNHIGLNTEQLNLANLASGIYTLRMQTNDGITVKKLVVMKNR